MAYFAPYISMSGLHIPTYADRLEDLAAAYRSVFGMDAELSESVPDYQLLSVFARALDDVSALVLQAYNSRNPAYATGAALDILLPQYGLTRQPGESDASVRNRIASALVARGTSTADALLAAVKSAPNVKDAKVYVNDTDAADANGIPAHHVAVVVRQGTAQAVADAIWAKKAPGIGTYGSTSQAVTDAFGETHTVNFSRVTEKAALVYVTVTKLEGCDESAVTAAVAPAVRDFVNGRGIAAPLNIPQLYAVCYAADPALAGTFVVSDIQVNIMGTQAMARDLLECAWNEKFSCPVNGVTVTYRTR